MKVNDQKISNTPQDRKRGSALLTAMIFSFVIGALSLTFLKLATSEYRASVRSTLYSSSLNLAESGVEMAMAALVERNAKSTDPNSWSTSSATLTGGATDYFVDDGVAGEVRYVIFDPDGLNPTVYAEGVIRGESSVNVVKQVRVTLTNGVKPYTSGFSARNGVTFTGNNVFLDSYNSNYGPYGGALNASAPFDYGYGGKNVNDDIIIAGDTLNAKGGDAISQGNATVYGYVSVAPGATASMGPSGEVTSYGDGSHDASRVLSDSYADLPAEAHPSGTYDSTYASITKATTITGSNDPSNPTYFDVSKIALSGNGAELTIEGNVVLVMSGDISVAGQGGIKVNTGASLKIYTGGDVSITGNGLLNLPGSPLAVEIIGTASTSTNNQGEMIAGQNIDISGNGQLAAAVYAPSAAVKVSGGGNSGSVYGVVVGFTSTIGGNSEYHYDEALRDVVMMRGTYSIDSWLEMTGVTAASKPIDITKYDSSYTSQGTNTY